jgi:hypothetical protein
MSRKERSMKRCIPKAGQIYHREQTKHEWKKADKPMITLHI